MTKIIKRDKQTSIPKVYGIAVLVVPVFSLLILHNIYYMSVQLENFDNLLAVAFSVIAVFAMNIVNFFLFDYLEKNFEIKSQNQLLTQQLQFLNILRFVCLTISKRYRCTISPKLRTAL